MKLCRRWLQNCLSNHKVCHERVTSRENWLPTRLLDTGDHNEPISLKLVDSKMLNPESTRYLALSHCWGKLVIITLKQSNLDQFKLGIPLESLSRTFHHAIVTTRMLGYRYLWIDSLCILQDSAEDWVHEASLMGDVYSQADCVIAATGSSDGDGGLFRPRNAASIQPFKIHSNWGTNQDIYTCFRDDIWTNEVVEAPLNKRGWVVQERMLSPRTLHFGKTQIFWECRQLEACETLPSGIPSDLIVAGHRAGNGFKRWMQPGGQDETGWHLGPETLHEAWQYVVEVYMGSQLTKGEDKLIALSGMAKKMSVVLNDTYVAGFWAKNLVNGMIWYVQPGIKGPLRSMRSTSYSAPSWSWAAIDGPVEFTSEDGLYDDFVTILDFSVTNTGEDPTGQVVSGHVTLKCIVKQIKKPEQYYWGGVDYCGNYHADDPVESDGIKEFFAVPLRRYKITADDEEELWGLVVHPVVRETQVFQRAGLFRLFLGDDIVNVGSVKEEERVKDFGFSGSEEQQVIKLI